MASQSPKTPFSTAGSPRSRGTWTCLQADPDVFVAGDLFWYPVENDKKTRRAPEVPVAFGHPKGDRSAYLQRREGYRPLGRLRDPLARKSGAGIGPQVPVRRDLRGRGILHLRPRRQHPRRLAPRGRHPAADSGDEWLYQSSAPGPLRARRWPTPALQAGWPAILHHDRTGSQAEEQRRRADELQRRADELQRRADELQRRADELQRQAEEQRSAPTISSGRSNDNRRNRRTKASRASVGPRD